MSSNSINYTDFVKFVHLRFEDRISQDDLDSILYLEEGYNKDSTTSLGKSLILSRLIFSGTKLDGSKYAHDQLLHKGINVWIADNHKGKSTIFKTIKFALTGTDKIKRDIKSWIEEILLEFAIGGITYTCYINRSGRDKGALFRFGIETFLELRSLKKLDSIDPDIEFRFKNRTEFEERVQDFFFEQFSFYTLKFTSKSSGKDNFELSTANLSWTTYFKSIYLESSDYEYLFFDEERFGAQGKKIFEMILGLPLTYPINMLSIQLDRIVEQIGKLKLVDKSRIEITLSRKDELLRKYNDVVNELTKLSKIGKLIFSHKPLIEEYNNLQKAVSYQRTEHRKANDAHLTEKDKMSRLEDEIYNLAEDLKKIEAEINRLTKQELNIDLYLKAESFFSNLEVKTCPHCEIAVSESKKTKERENHTCSLCGETPSQPKVDEDELQIKVARIKSEIQQHTLKNVEKSKVLEQQRQAFELVKESVAQSYGRLIKLPSIDGDVKRLQEIEDLIDDIDKEREIQKNQVDKRDELLKEEAVLKFRLDEIEKQKSSSNELEIQNLSLTKEILEYALSSLGKKRTIFNSEILKKLQDLILKEVNSFGLVSITQVNIDDRFNLELTQNNVVVGFTELEPGEKLRIKLAFYLSLIQLDIEHALGRHPRFLIFDSPGSEEMVPKHLQGLSDMFKMINERFKDQLQIFVGSALRDFEHITDQEKTFIKGEDEFVF